MACTQHIRTWPAFDLVPAKHRGSVAADFEPQSYITTARSELGESTAFLRSAHTANIFGSKVAKVPADMLKYPYYFQARAEGLLVIGNYFSRYLSMPMVGYRRVGYILYLLAQLLGAAWRVGLPFGSLPLRLLYGPGDLCVAFLRSPLSSDRAPPL